MKATEIKDRYTEENKERLVAYQQVFDSEAGQVVLNDLRHRFYDADLLTKDSPHATHYNLGLRDCVRHIIETTEVAKDV